MNQFIISALKERLAKVNEEKAVLEEYIYKESGIIGIREAVELTFQPSTNSHSAKMKFPEWLEHNSIKLKRKDKRYSKFYQRYKAEMKKTK